MMSSQRRLEGRKALVTGGSRGIGFGIAEEFVKQGADVMLAATNLVKLEEAQAALTIHGTQVEIAQVDVSSREACEALVQQSIKKLGKLEILVNCAAIYIPHPFLDYTVDEFDRVMKTNLYGPFHLSQIVLPHLLERGWGRIINIASAAGKWASKNQAAYNIAKHGLVGLTRCVALETAGSGVTVNAICPGIVQTDLVDSFLTQHAEIAHTTPEAIRQALLQRQSIGRFLDVSECGHLAVYLASPESDGMTGQSLSLDGGMLFL